MYQTRPHFFAVVADAAAVEEEEADMVVMLVVVKGRGCCWCRGCPRCWRCRAKKDEVEDEDEDSTRANAEESLVLGRAAAADAVAALWKRMKHTRVPRAAERRSSPNMHT